MATLVRVTPVGTDIRSFGAPWQIAGVSVDNPSGSWLTIPNVGNVPPYTMGWATSVTPTVMHIDVLFTASPSGSPSELVGDPVTVTLYDEAIADDPGVPSGAQQSQSPVLANIRRVTQATSVPEAGVSVSFGGVPATDQQRVIPIQFRMSLITPLQGLVDYSAFGPFPSHTPSALVGMSFITGLVGALAVELALAISPSSPSIVHTFPQGYRFGIGHTIQLRFWASPGAGKQVIAWAFDWYEQVG